MGSRFFFPVLLFLLGGNLVAGETALCTTKACLLQIDRVTDVQHLPTDAFGLVAPSPTLYRLAFESEPIVRERNGDVRIRVWCKTMQS